MNWNHNIEPLSTAVPGGVLFPVFPTSARFLAVNLFDRADVERHLSEFHDVTHVYYKALQMRPSPFRGSGVGQ